MVSTSSSPIRFLTGITTSGTPHLGNYVGSVRPSVRFSRDANVQSFYFLADFHALIKTDEPARIQRSTLEIAACWLACGLDPERVTFYRQSDIPEIPELTWLLTCVTAKGVLNRAHAYKAAIDRNTAAGQDSDAEISAGLFMYPVLMAADILMFNAHKVPVGRDQIQHIEMARDIGQRFNHQYGMHFTLPEAEIDDAVATLPGLDGRKMSKSYGNTIALFAPRAQLKKQIMAIVTDSRAPGEPKPTDGSALFQIFQAFAQADETDALREAFAEGIAWGEAKERVFERVDAEIAPLRSRYEALIGDPVQIEQILLAGAEKARGLSGPFLQRLRNAVGLRSLAAQTGGGIDGKARPKASKQTRAGFRQYREGDGNYYFKLLDNDGQTLLQSVGFSSPQEAGRAIAQLRSDGEAGLLTLRSHVEALSAEAERAVVDLLKSLALAQTSQSP